MRSIFVDWTGFVNPCSLRRAASSIGLTRSTTTRSIAGNAANGIATHAEPGAAEDTANSRLRDFRDMQAGIRRDGFTPRTQHAFAQKRVELRHHRITRRA